MSIVVMTLVLCLKSCKTKGKVFVPSTRSAPNINKQYTASIFNCLYIVYLSSNLVIFIFTFDQYTVHIVWTFILQFFQCKVILHLICMPPAAPLLLLSPINRSILKHMLIFSASMWEQFIELGPDSASMAPGHHAAVPSLVLYS